VIHIADERLVRLVALGKKTTHRFPANYRQFSGKVTHPKISAGNVHKVYTVAPFGVFGDPGAPALLEVMVTSVELDILGDITDDEARQEGFSSLDAYIVWWDRTWFRKGLKFDNHLHNPIWVVSFKLKGTLPAGDRLIERLEKGLRTQSKAGR
jgi:hypothetical protein